MGHYVVPQSLDAQSVLDFSKVVRSREGSGNEVVIDFGSCRFVTPFGLLMLLYSVQQRSSGCHLSIRPGPTSSYLEHFGFSQALAGVTEPLQQKITETSGIRYLPISMISIATLRAAARASFQVVQSEIARTATRLAEALLQCDTGPAVRTLQFCMQELLRNVVEHSGADRLFLAAQHWPAREHTELAILDGGIGIHRSLLKNPALSIQGERHALELAILPGVSESRVTDASDDEWAHSGYGLYMTSSIGRSLGTFVLASGQSVLTLDRNKKNHDSVPLMGTCICLNVSTSAKALNDLRTEDLLARGEQLQEELKLAHYSPNAASRSLRLDGA